MKIAVVCKEGTVNAHYRAVLPGRALERRGHTVMWVQGDGNVLAHLAQRRPSWDVTLIQQRHDPAELEEVRRLRAAGIAVVWDSDDDLSSIPRKAPVYTRVGGRKGVRRMFEESVAMAGAATVMTTPSERIAEIYRGHGVHVEVVENYVDGRETGQPRPRTPGVVVGLCAATEHIDDLRKLKIAQTIKALLERHEAVRFLSIGFDLQLRDPRCSWVDRVPFERLIAAERRFDIGLAPLADTPFARARSNVKLKEYAAAGAMWLASPVGPYVGMGEEQGGLLVDRREWLDALDGLVGDYERRLELAGRARAWAEGETIEKNVRRWERVFRTAIEREHQATRAAV